MEPSWVAHATVNHLPAYLQTLQISTPHINTLQAELSEYITTKERHKKVFFQDARPLRGGGLVT